MSLHHLANEIQKKGRGDDSMLMHVTPNEVKGLQAIARAHGGSLTVNPDTGLVEAGFLKNILPSLLPMAAGAAITGLSGGALGPAAAAMLVGGGYGLATGSVEKGLTAGLGAYGGAGLEGELAKNATTQAAVESTQAGVIPDATRAAAANAPTPGGFQYTGSGEMVPANYPQAVTGATSAVPQATPAPMSNWDKLVSGTNNTFGSIDNTGKFLGENYGKIGMAAAPAIASSMEVDPYTPEEYKRDPNALRLSKDFQGYVPQRPNPYYRPTGLGYAAGGIAALAPNNNMFPQSQQVHTNFATPTQMPTSAEVVRADYDTATQPFTGQETRMAEGGVPKKAPKAKITGERNLRNMDPMDAALAELNNARYGANMSQFEQPKAGLASLGALPYAAGGQLGGYSDGGRMLKGPGDGMSDSIPAHIGGKQPARLADGEFVVPADVVSHLGNGSTDAGAKRLYSMMDKVRQARTGNKKQGKQINPTKFMPA